MSFVKIGNYLVNTDQIAYIGKPSEHCDFVTQVNFLDKSWLRTVQTLDEVQEEIRKAMNDPLYGMQELE